MCDVMIILMCAWKLAQAA